MIVFFRIMITIIILLLFRKSNIMDSELTEVRYRNIKQQKQIEELKRRIDDFEN